MEFVVITIMMITVFNGILCDFDISRITRRPAVLCREAKAKERGRRLFLIVRVSDGEGKESVVFDIDVKDVADADLTTVHQLLFQLVLSYRQP